LQENVVKFHKPATSATTQQHKYDDNTLKKVLLPMLLVKTLFYLYYFLLYTIYFLLATIATRRNK